MSIIKFQGDPSGTGIFTISSPSTNTDRTLSLPGTTSTILGIDNTPQTLTNKTLGAGLVMDASVVTSTSAVATTSGTAVTIATDIPSWVNRISVVLFAVSTSGTARPLIQFGTGSTPTYVTTGYASGSDNYSAAIGTVATSTTGFLCGRTSAAGYQWNILYMFMRFSPSSDTWVGSMRGSTSVTATVASGGGRITLTEPLTAIRLTTTASDTFDNGSVNILYG